MRFERSSTDDPDAARVQVWDSSAEIRHFVLPERPDGTEGMAEDDLAELIDRNTIIGTGVVAPP